MPSMSDFLKNAPKKALSDTAKQQWDLDTSPADIPDDIVEWRRTHKQKEISTPIAAVAPTKAADVIDFAKTNDSEVPFPAKAHDNDISSDVSSQPNSQAITQFSSQVNSQSNRLKDHQDRAKYKKTVNSSMKVSSQPNSQIHTKPSSRISSQQDSANLTANLSAKVDSQVSSQSNTQVDTQVSSHLSSQTTTAISQLGNWQRILDQGDKAILEFLWINRQTDNETRILNFDEISLYSKIPYGTTRYKLDRLSAHALIDTSRRAAVGKLKGKIYFLNCGNIAQAFPLLVQQGGYTNDGRVNDFDSPVDSQLSSKVDSQRNTQRPCSSSILNTTTTKGGGLPKTNALERAAIAEQLRHELISAEWEGLDVGSLLRYVFQDGKWIHSVSELQDFLDKAAAAVDYSKKTKSPISSALGFLHSCLAKWSVDTPPGYESRQERALRFRLEEEKKRLENLKRLNQELAVTRFKTFVAEQKPELIKELREAAKEAGKTSPVGGKRVERHHYVSSLVDLFFEKEIIEGITKEVLLDVPDLI